MTTEILAKKSFKDIHREKSYDFTHLAESSFECDVIFKEIFVNNDYRFGEYINIKDNNTIIDIGGNFGFFSVFAATFAKNLNFYIFEPIPATFCCLQNNIDRYVSPLGHKVHTFEKGIAHINTSMDLNYYPGFSSLSSLFHQPTDTTMSNAFKTLRQEVYDQVKMALEAYNIDETPESVWSQAAKKKQTISCQLLPLSEVIENEKIDCIDLLKIDTQGAEVDVINGIKEEDWPKIQQIALEINMWKGLKSIDFDFFSFFENKGYDVTMMSSKLTPWNNRLLFASRKV